MEKSERKETAVFYRREIVMMLEKENDEKWLRQIYMMMQVMQGKKAKRGG